MKGEAEHALQVLGDLDLGTVLCSSSFGEILFANDTARALLGLRDDDATVPAELGRVVSESIAREVATGVFTSAARLVGADGARLFVRCKRLPRRRLLVTIAREMVRERELAELLVQRFALTRRECQVVSLARSGLSNEQIGNQLQLSAGTVKWYLNRILPSIGARNRRELMALVEDLVRSERAD